MNPTNVWIISGLLLWLIFSIYFLFFRKKSKASNLTDSGKSDNDSVNTSYDAFGRNTPSKLGSSSEKDKSRFAIVFKKEDEDESLYELLADVVINPSMIINGFAKNDEGKDIVDAEKEDPQPMDNDEEFPDEEFPDVNDEVEADESEYGEDFSDDELEDFEKDLH